jgi:hypothetical protein
MSQWRSLNNSLCDITRLSLHSTLYGFPLTCDNLLLLHDQPKCCQLNLLQECVLNQLLFPLFGVLNLIRLAVVYVTAQ